VSAPVVETAQGRARGTAENGVAVFKGLPYAAPPFGALRFKAPAPPEPWKGVRDATNFGPTVPKAPYRLPFSGILEEPVIEGEECLNLNVWTPEAAGGGLPVLVWIHGGAYRNGSGAVSLYDGSAFARDGAVVVTLNYRLGADGFLILDDAPANRGLLDLIAALQWIKANIAAFGGDPEKVTIFGQSAGAMAVTTLLAMPSAQGLFKRVIAQSGVGHRVMSTDDAAKVTSDLAKRLGAPPNREGFAAVPLDRLYAAQFALTQDIPKTPTRWGEIGITMMPFAPVVDDASLPQDPLDAVRSGVGAGVELLLGSNTDEHRFFLVPPGLLDVLDDRFVDAALRIYGGHPTRLREAYGERFSTPGELFAAAATDFFFRLPDVSFADARAAGAAGTWTYEFAWRSPLFSGRLGACHYLEVPFVFDTLDAPSAALVTGNAPPQAIADEMHRYWLAFAATGDPGWPRYTPERRAVMTFDLESDVVEDPRSEQRTAWLAQG
jgi:para-nitrobenzyl esterase